MKMTHEHIISDDKVKLLQSYLDLLKRLRDAHSLKK